MNSPSVFRALPFKKRWFGIVASAAMLCLFFIPAPSYGTTDAKIDAWCKGGSIADEGDPGKYVKGPESIYTLEQPISGVTQVGSAGEYLQLVYQLALGLVGIIAVVLIMFGGLLWVQAAGNEQQISSAKELIISAVVGLLIALLSYTILTFINPEILRTDIQVAVIPVTPECPYPKPEIIAFPASPNTAGGGQACPSYVEAFGAVVARLAIVCPNCKIGIGSTYRTPEQQQPLRDCYEQAMELEYYAADEKTKIKAGCPASCANIGCNVASKPCCSNHQRGFAGDLWFEYTPPFAAGYETFFSFSGIDLSKVAATSAGKLRMECNNGACEEDAAAKTALANNQRLLRVIMETPIDIDGDGDDDPLFQKDGSEWWHFNLIDKSSCALNTGPWPCETNATTGFATKQFCIHNGLTHSKTYATCVDGQASCAHLSGPSDSWYIAGDCPDNQHQQFAADASVDPSFSESISVYTVPPECQPNTSS